MRRRLLGVPRPARGAQVIPSALLVNPFAFYWDDHLVGDRDVAAARRLRSAEGWRRLASGEVSADRIRSVARTAAAHARSSAVAAAGGPSSRVEPERADLDRLRDAGKRLSC